MDTLHRVPNWKKAIREIHRVLKKNGRFLLRDYSIETFCFPGVGLILQKIIDKPYDQMFDQIELLTFIRKNGFVITQQNDSSWMIMMAATKKAVEKE
jgi:ubiquinone/menaquinone biosynthesis C-methylase UbiE